MHQTYYHVVEGTWPPAAITQHGPVTLRLGEGGGSRVSAATAEGPVGVEQIQAAETAMQEMGQDRLFMIRAGDEALDAQLAARGYVIKDPVNIWVCPPSQLMDVEIPRVTTFCIWEPIAIQKEIWLAGGIGPERLAVMERAKGAKTALLARCDDKPAGVGFVAIHDGVAMVHALEIPPHHRRRGMGSWMVRQAAFWAHDHGAQELALVCTQENTAANGLYAALGMSCVGAYHYRHKP